MRKTLSEDFTFSEKSTYLKYVFVQCVCVYGGIAGVERGGIHFNRDVALFINTWTQHCIYQEKKRF